MKQGTKDVIEKEDEDSQTILSLIREDSQSNSGTLHPLSGHFTLYVLNLKFLTLEISRNSIPRLLKRTVNRYRVVWHCPMCSFLLVPSPDDEIWVLSKQKQDGFVVASGRYS